MTRFFKNLTIAVGVLILSTAIFFVVHKGGPIKQDILRHSLKLLGEQLLAMVPDNEQGLVVDRWNDFVAKAEKGELPPKQIERVAVGILNASAMDTTLSKNDALVLFNLNVNDPARAFSFAFSKGVPGVNPVEGGVASVSPVPDPALSRNVEIQKSELEKLGKELQMACEFNSTIRKSIEADPEKRKYLTQYFRYQMDDGIRVNADRKLKDDLGKAEYQNWAPKIEMLEKERMLNWQNDFSQELQKEMQTLKVQMDSLKIMIHLQNRSLADSLKENTFKEQSEALKALENLRNLRVLEQNEIEQIVKDQIEAQGGQVPTK